jgi:hypothetical protein
MWLLMTSKTSRERSSLMNPPYFILFLQKNNITNYKNKWRLNQ